MTLRTGAKLGSYEVLGPLGAGGMGEVYRARDTRLGREVALKVLPAEVAHDPERLARFQREAQTLAALDHPSIVTLYSVEQADDTHFLTMQLVEGESLNRLIPAGGVTIERFLDIAPALAEALAAAHEKDIVHRDLKPGNVMVASTGRVKVLDFGLAKALRPASEDDETMPVAERTATGVVLGTPSYMSPEQVEARAVHAPSDIFSLGIVLYELATGRRPFRGDSPAARMSSILRDTPERPAAQRADLPKEIDALIVRCLARNSAERPTALEVRDDLRRITTARAPYAGGFTRSPLFVPATVAVLAIMAAAGYFIWSTMAANQRAVFVAESLPRIEALARDGKYLEAFALAQAVDERAGGPKVADDLWNLAATRVSVASKPAGAEVTLRPFGYAGGSVALGRTPLDQVRVPRGAFHWRVERTGNLPADLVTNQPGTSLRFDLRPDTADPSMVRVPGGQIRLWTLGGVRPADNVTLDPFLIDRHEVTNREYATFVKASGYTRRELWKHAFEEDTRALGFDEAMARFKDTTGRAGPATWRLGSFPDGTEDLPVTGLSWYEAAAFAAFSGKELPTIYHWYLADTADDIQLLPGLVLSTTNHEGQGPRPATGGGPVSMSAHGALDMAGNVREWVTNPSDGGTRLTLGGAWSDPAYLYLFPEALSPFDRSAGNGMRAMKRETARGAATEALAVENASLPGRTAIDRRTQAPVKDAEFAVFTRFYERRKTPLDTRIETRDDSSPHWRKEKVSFAAGYGDERMLAWLYTPKNSRPPYQAVIQMSGAAAFYRRSSATEQDIFGWNYAEYLIRGGRAVMIPIFKGSYERSDGFHPLRTEWPSYRDHVVQWASELQQTVDYLQSRDDIAAGKIAYQGTSNGAIWGPLFMALEPRLRTGIFLLGGALTMPLRSEPMPPEIDSFHFAPRVKAPVLMMNGRHDAIFPYETAQVPLFRALGTPAADKRHLVFPGGHSSFGWTNELIKEGLDWLDKRLGPVT